MKQILRLTLSVICYVSFSPAGAQSDRFQCDDSCDPNATGAVKYNVVSPVGFSTVELSPILSNIMLTELDRELERRGLPFVRYADDCVIFCKSPRAAERVCESIAKFIERKLFLKVNREKTHVGSVHGQKFLGYSFNM